MGVGPSQPGVGYSLLVCPFAKALGKAQYWGGSYLIFQVLCVSVPLARKRNSLPHLHFPGEAMPRPASALTGQAATADQHQLSGTAQ